MLKGDTGAKRTWFYENGAFVAAALAAVLWHVVLSTNVGDDMVYFKTLLDGNSSLSEILAHRYETWSSRMVIEAVLIPLVHCPLLWKILDIVIFTSLPVLLCGLLGVPGRGRWFVTGLVLLYPFAEERHGYKIIEYEIYRYQVRHGMYADGQTSLRDVAFFNMEYHPEYFGTYPAPLATPRGRTARYKPLMNGVFWIETGTGEEVLAVCYPIWNCDFSETVLKQSEQTEEDVREGIDSTLGYLFFSKRASSLALFELWGQYEELRAGGLINYPALMNYIWTYFPEYAATYNIQNQMGMHDTFGLLMNALGAEVELQNNPNEVIVMSTAAGLDFLNF